MAVGELTSPPTDQSDREFICRRIVQ